MSDENFWTNSLRRLVGTDNKPKEQKTKPKGYSARANERVTEFFADKPRNVSHLDENWNIYSQSEVPYAAVTALSYNAVGDWRVRCEDEKSREYIYDFLRLTDFDSVVLDVIRDCCVFGDAFVEKVYFSNGDLAELKLRDPRTFQIKIDAKGDVLGYVQTVKTGDGSKTIELKPEEVVHYQLFTIPHSPYGLALIDPSRDTMKRKTVADEGITAAMDRHGFPKYHIKLKTPKGYEDEIPSSTEIDSIASDFKNLNLKNEIVTSELIEITPLDVKGIQNVEEYFNYFQSSVTCGVLVPQEVLGLGSGSTEATARVRRLMFEKLVRGFQRKVARTTEINVLEELAPDKKARIIFADSVPEDDAILAESIHKLMPRGDPFAILTRDEIRERLGYPPVVVANQKRKAIYNKYGISSKADEMEQPTNGTQVDDLQQTLNRYSSKVEDYLRDYVE